MPCEHVDTCEYKLTLDQFATHCFTIYEFGECPFPDPPHLKTPSDWGHYFRIVNNTLGEKGGRTMKGIILHMDCKHIDKGLKEKPCVDFMSTERKNRFAEDCPYFEYPDYDSSTSSKTGEENEM